MAIVPAFPGGVDPLALDSASYSSLAQAGGGFDAAFSNVAALGGMGGASLTGGLGGMPNSPQAMQSLMVQAIMQNYQFLSSIWQELGVGMGAPGMGAPGGDPSGAVAVAGANGAAAAAPPKA